MNEKVIYPSMVIRSQAEVIELLEKENKRLKEQLLVAQTNEETFRLEMEDITQTLGLDEDTIFDDVKTYARSLKENKILRENAEHNDKVVDKVNWENMLLKKENKQLKEELKYTVPIVEHNKIVSKKLKENQKQKEVIDKVNKYINKMFDTGFYNDDYYLGHLKMILEDKEV